MAFVAHGGVSIHKAIIGLYRAGFHKVIKDLFQCWFIPGTQPNQFWHKYIKCKTVKEGQEGIIKHMFNLIDCLLNIVG